MAITVSYEPRLTDWQLEATNLATNPSFETTSGTVELRRNLHPNPSLETAVTSNQWAAGANVAGATTTNGRIISVGIDGGYGWRKQWTVADPATNNSPTIQVLGTDAASSTAISASTTYAASVWFQSTRAGTFFLRQFEYNAGAVQVATSNGGSIVAVAGDWYLLSVVFTSTSTTTAVRFEIATSTSEIRPVGTTWVADRFLMEASGVVGSYFDGSNRPRIRENLCQNPSFEVDTFNWVALSSTISRVTTQQYVGTAAGQSVTPGSAVNEGLAYTVAGQFAAVGSTWSAGVMVKAPVGALLYVTLLTSATTGTTSTNFVGTGDWQRVTVGGNVTTATSRSAPQLYVRTRTSAQAITFWVDAAIIEQTSAVGAYFDGATSAASGVGYGWNGTANSSASYSYDSDLTASWTGTANGSPSTVTALAIADAPAAVPAQATRYATSSAFSRNRAARFVLATTGTINLSFTNASPTSGATATIMVRVRPRDRDTTMAPQIRGAAATGRVYPKGVWTLEQVTLTAGAGAASLTGFALTAGAGHQSGDVIDIDTIVVTNGDYSGTPFDGETVDGTLRQFAWTGAVDASTSTVSTREYIDADAANPNAASSYTARLDATPHLATDVSAQTPEFNVAIPLGQPISRYRQRGGGIALRDDESRGILVGLMDGFSSRNEEATIPALSPLNALVARVTIPPFSGTFEEFITTMIDLVDPALPTQFAADIADIEVRHPTMQGTAWDILNETCLIHQVECVMYQEVITFRKIRGAAFLHTNLSDMGHDYTTGPRSEYIEVVSYNINELTPVTGHFWPRGELAPFYDDRRENENTISIGSGATVVQGINLTDYVSLTSVQQPIATDVGGPIPPNESYYRIIDKDNNPISSAWWLASGGSVRIEITDDGNGMDIIATAPESEQAPFQLASMTNFLGNGLTAARYDLNIHGTGVIMEPETFRFHTGANPSEVVQEVGTTIELQGTWVDSLALRMAQDAMLEYSVPTQSISGSTGIAELIALDDNWAALATGAIGEDAQMQWYQERLFLALVGSRIRYMDSYYRITHVEFSEDNISFDAIADTRDYDVQDVWDYAGLTYGDGDTLFAGLTWEEWEAMPLFLTEGTVYGEGYYGEGVYGE